MAATGRKQGLIYESVLEYLKGKLLAGDFEVGEQLPTVAQLSKQLAVGQSSVREAYRILEQMGILEITQGRGTFVSSKFLDDDDLMKGFQLADQPTRMHLVEARLLLEPGVAALAASRATPAEANAILQEAIRHQELCPDVARWVDLNIRFHDLIVLAAHNPILAQMHLALQEARSKTRPRTQEVSRSAEKAMQHHRLIAMAIQEGNAEAARALMQQHIGEFEQQLREYLQRSIS